MTQEQTKPCIVLFYPHYTIVVKLWLVYQQHAVVINGECHDITICQELNNLIPEPTDVTIQSRSFNQTDPDYNKLLEEFYNSRIHNSSWIANIDCAECNTDGQELSSDYRIVRTGVDKLILERHPMRRGNANVFAPGEPRVSDQVLPEDRQNDNIVETIPSQPAFRSSYNNRPSPRWLMIANAVLHGLCAILLTISALITIKRG